MSQPYLGEIRMFAGNFAPDRWAFCAGQLLPITENEVLFNLIGTIYGGDGQSTFGLPDLQGRIPVHMGTALQSGTTYLLGQNGGVENTILQMNQMPAHTHLVHAQSENGMGGNPKDGVWASSSLEPYASGAPDEMMNALAVSTVGGSQPHDNMMPFVCVSFIISLFGIYPSQS
jgi:microcystin-dependent protein